MDFRVWTDSSNAALQHGELFVHVARNEFAERVRHAVQLLDQIYLLDVDDSSARLAKRSRSALGAMRITIDLRTNASEPWLDVSVSPAVVGALGATSAACKAVAGDLMGALTTVFNS